MQAIILLPGEQIPLAFYNQQTKINRDTININPEKMTLEAKKAGLFEIKEKKIKQKKNKSQEPKQLENQPTEQEIKIRHGCQKYQPKIEDFVIGVIKQKTNDFYTLNIGGPTEAYLSAYDFEGATKKSKPNLEVGQLVYTRVTANHKFLRTKCSCINPKSKKEWVSGETLFGDLKGGVTFQIPIDKCNSLKELDFILKEIQKIIAFEVAIGKNGRVWVKCQNERNSTVFINALKSAINLPYEQISEFIQGIAHLFQK